MALVMGRQWLQIVGVISMGVYDNMFRIQYLLRNKVDGNSRLCMCATMVARYFHSEHEVWEFESLDPTCLV